MTYMEYNNPVNLEATQPWAGWTGGTYAGRFAIFDSPEMGLRAALRDARIKMQKHNGDIEAMLTAFAPGNENPTQNYIDFVKGRVGDRVTSDGILDFVKAQFDFENLSLSNYSSLKEKYFNPQTIAAATELEQFQLPEGMDFDKAKTLTSAYKEAARNAAEPTQASLFDLPSRLTESQLNVALAPEAIKGPEEVNILQDILGRAESSIAAEQQAFEPSSEPKLPPVESPKVGRSISDNLQKVFEMQRRLAEYEDAQIPAAIAEPRQISAVPPTTQARDERVQKLIEAGQEPEVLVDAEDMAMDTVPEELRILRNIVESAEEQIAREEQGYEQADIEGAFNNFMDVLSKARPPQVALGETVEFAEGPVPEIKTGLEPGDITRSEDAPPALEREPFRPIPPELEMLSAREQRLIEERTTFGEAANAAFAVENIMSWAFNGMEEYKPDLDFEMTEENFAALTKDVPEEYHDFVEDATSMAHGMAMRRRVLKTVEYERQIANYGWGGTSLRIAAAFLDPAAIGISVATEGFAAPLIWGNKLTRLGRVLRGATGAAVSNMAIESYLVSQDATRDPYDILFAGLAGTVLGGAVGGVLGRGGPSSTEALYYKALQKAADDVQQAQASDVAEGLKASGATARAGIPDEQMTIDNPMGADNQVEVVKDGQFVYDENAPFSDGPLGWTRFDMVGQMMKSTLASVRSAARIFGEDAVGFNADGTRVAPSADIYKTILERVYLNDFYKVYRNEYKAWAKSQGIGFGRRYFNTHRARFGQLVSDAIERPDLPHHPAIARAAQRQSKVLNDILKEAQTYKVKGFETIPDNLRYFTHMWDTYKFVDVAQQLGQNGTESIAALFARAMLNETPEMGEELAEKIALRLVKKLQRQDAGLDSGLARVFSADQREILRDILIEEEILEEGEANLLVKLFEKKDEGVPARAKRRLQLDVNAEMRLDNGAIIRVKDFMERDAEKVMTAYISQMAGRIALARVGVRSNADYAAIVSGIKKEAQEKFGGGSERKIAGDLENLDVMYNMILGRPSPMVKDPGSKANRAARLAMDYNFIRLMNQVGFAQFSELGNAASIAGWRALVSQIPELKSLLTRLPNMDIKDPIVRDLDKFFGLGSDRFLNQAINRHNVEDMLINGRGDIIDKASYFLQPLKRTVADISGLAPITLALQRAAGRIATQFLVDVAFKNKTLSLKRLNGLGLDADMSQRVFEQIRENAVMAPSGIFKKYKARAINLEDWDDVGARNAFGVAIARWSRRSIQENDIGNLNRYMTSTMGKILMQFRTFTLVSWSKQFLHGLTANDWRAYSGFIWSALTGGLGYYSQTMVNSVGQKDRDEYLKERLAPLEIGKSMFARSTWASLLPSVIDSGAAFFSDDPIFAYTRTTGLEQRFSLSSVPTFDLVYDAYDSVTGAARALQPDYQFSQGQARALRSIAPFQNAIGIKTMLDMFVESRPRSAIVD